MYMSQYVCWKQTELTEFTKFMAEMTQTSFGWVSFYETDLSPKFN